ncbi:MAG TPA: hypothetical protein VFM35_03300, partial [Candidatus Binatia bacterium]|nr:hypothetical protein [Candidatus Binatia bacterium]
AGRPLLSPEAVHEYTERIVNPRPARKEKERVAPEITQPHGAAQQEQLPVQTVSRARAIFDASENLKPFDPADFDFAMTEDEPTAEEVRTALQGSTPANWAQPAKPRPARILGMTPVQLAIIAGLLLILAAILATFAYLVFMNF